MSSNYKNQYSFLLLRLLIGIGFIVHGWAKLRHGIGGFEELLSQMGIPLAHLMSWLVALTELLGGFLLFLGIFVTFISIPLIITMLVAMFTVQIHYGFSTIKTIGLTSSGPLFGPPGYEINLLYVAGLIVLIVNGSGAFALDRMFFRKRTPAE